MLISSSYPQFAMIILIYACQDFFFKDKYLESHWYLASHNAYGNVGCLDVICPENESNCPAGGNSSGQ